MKRLLQQIPRSNLVTSAPVSNILRALSAADTIALKKRLTGEVITPGDDNYDEARFVPNLTYSRRPAAIVRARTTNDVAEAVRFARSRNIPFTARGGGHSIAGHSVIDDGIVIDFSAMKGVQFDTVSRTARVQPGATTNDLCVPAAELGLAVSTGDTSTVGIAGLTLGGGIGWMARKHGLAIDNLLSVELVTARGEVVRASATEHSDLFWALRGGGGNFGIVTEFEFQLHPDAMIYGGALVLPLTSEVLRGYLDYAVNAPDELTTITFVTHAPPAPFIPEDRIGEPVLMILAVYAGPEEEGKKVLAPLRALAEPIADAVQWMPYPEIFNFTAAAAQPHYGAVRASFAHEINDKSIDTIIKRIGEATSPMSMIQLRPLGGAFGRVPLDATAFAQRDKKFFVAVIAIWLDGSEDAAAHNTWADDSWLDMLSIFDGNYVNFLGNEGERRIREAYQHGNYERLAEVKRRYDPDNTFRFNQNIRP